MQYSHLPALRSFSEGVGISLGIMWICCYSDCEYVINPECLRYLGELWIYEKESRISGTLIIYVYVVADRLLAWSFDPPAATCTEIDYTNQSPDALQLTAFLASGQIVHWLLSNLNVTLI